MRHLHKWTKKEEEFLINNYSKNGIKFCCEYLKLSKGSIKHKASSLKIKIINKWTKQDDEFLRKNINLGRDYCAKTLKRSHNAINLRLSFLGIKRKKDIDDHIDFIKKEYPIHGLKWCSLQTGVKKSTIKSQMHRMNIKILPETMFKIRSENSSFPRPSICGVDANNFINVKTKEAAYILGILWADGYLNNKSQNYRINMELVRNDLDEILPIFQSQGKWTISYRNRKNRQEQGTIATSNKTLYEFLKTCDYEVKSTGSANKILSNINKELHPYWWRGYFDGDGSWGANPKIYQYRMCMCGSYNQDWSFVENLATIGFKYVIDKTVKENSSNSIVRSIGGLQNLYKFGEYIYKDYDNIGLKRKYNKYKIIRDAYLHNFT